MSFLRVLGRFAAPFIILLVAAMSVGCTPPGLTQKDGGLVESPDSVFIGRWRLTIHNGIVSQFSRRKDGSLAFGLFVNGQCSHATSDDIVGCGAGPESLGGIGQLPVTVSGRNVSFRALPYKNAEGTSPGRNSSALNAVLTLVDDGNSLVQFSSSIGYDNTVWNYEQVYVRETAGPNCQQDWDCTNSGRYSLSCSQSVCAPTTCVRDSDCPSGTVCDAFAQSEQRPRVCLGAPEWTKCLGVDVRNDPKNCGACFRDCGGSSCNEGQCQPIQLAYFGVRDAGGVAPDTDVGSGEILAVDETHVFWRHDGTREVERVEKKLGTRESISTVLGDVRLLFPIAGDLLYFQSSEPGNAGIMRIPKAGGTMSLVHQPENFGGNLVTDGTSFFWSRSQPIGVDSVPVAGGTAVRVKEAKDCLPAGESALIKASTSKYLVLDPSSPGNSPTLCAFTGGGVPIPELKGRALAALYGDTSFWQNATSVHVVSKEVYGPGAVDSFPITAGSLATAGKQGLHVVVSGGGENEIVRYLVETGSYKVLARFEGKPFFAMVEDDDWIYFSTLEALYRLRK